MLTTVPWPMRAIPQVVVAGKFQLTDRAFQVAYRSHTMAIHLHLYTGQMRFGAEMISLQPGDVTISPAFSTTSYDLPLPGSHWCIHVLPPRSPGQRMRLPLLRRLAQRSSAMVERMQRIAQVFSQHSAQRGQPAAQHACATQLASGLLTQELLVFLAHQPEAEVTMTRGMLAADRAVAWIAERFHEPLTVAGIAAELGVSADHLARCFRQRCGRGMLQELHAVRVARARELLTTSTMPIGTIARLVGIPDPHHFNKHLRRATGHSPSALRNQRQH